MQFDNEGHIAITPAEFENLARTDARRLINNVILAGTPQIFEKYEQYCRFLHLLSGELRIHPRNVAVIGSGNLGFSMTPRPEKLWAKVRPDSDIHLAIVDQHYYEFLDEHIRDWELANRDIFDIKSNAAVRFAERKKTRGNYFLRWDDLPGQIEAVKVFRHSIDGPEARKYRAECCQRKRKMKAFLYRDWKSMFRKCQDDLRELAQMVDADLSLRGGDQPRAV